MSELALTILRWAARLAAVALACMYILMMTGEFTSPHSGPPTHFFEWAGIALLTLTCAGALIAWKWELHGAILSLASLGLFMLLVRMGTDIVIYVIATPAILFLLDWGARHTHLHHRH